MIEIGFLGGGRMATAIRDGLLGSISKDTIGVFDPTIQSSRDWADCVVFKQAEQLFAQCRC